MVAYLDDFPSLLVSFLMDGLYAYAYCILLNDYWSESSTRRLYYSIPNFFSPLAFWGYFIGYCV